MPATLFKDLVAADTHQRAALPDRKRKAKGGPMVALKTADDGDYTSVPLKPTHTVKAKINWLGKSKPASFDKAAVVKVDESLGLVFGFAIVSKKDGADYYDLQDDHIPEDAMLKASLDFMENSRVAKEMHSGEQAGNVVFAFPLTTDIAAAVDIVTKQTGLLIAMRPAPGMLAKFKSGEFTGFSIGGFRVEDEDSI